MRTQSSGSASLLMFLSMAVMGVVGVFGVPQFAPVVASPGDDGDEQLPDSFGSFQKVEAGELATKQTDDLFAAVESPGDDGLSPENSAFPVIDFDRLEDETNGGMQIGDLLSGLSKPTDRRTGARAAKRREDDETDRHEHPHSGADRTPQNALAHGRHSAPAEAITNEHSGGSRSIRFDSRFGRENKTASISTPFDKQPASRPLDREEAAAGFVVDPAPVHSGTSGRNAASETDAPGEPLSWRTAVDRLRTLGIRHYRLSPGTEPSEFHFSCFFSPADNPRVTHRFEAEADQPLQAVEKVLAQIDGWRNQR